MKTRILYLLICLCSVLSQSAAQVKVIGYLPTWANYPASVNSVQLSKLTHINIAFANPDASGNLIPADGTDADVVTVVTAAHAQNVKVFLSIGGAGAPATTYHNLLNTTVSMNNFVSKIVTYATTNNLDGIDVDIEGDVLDGTNLTDTNYENFVTALGTALHTNSKLMSAALAQWFGNYVTTNAAAQFDWINMMSYDAAIPGSGDPVGQHAPYSMVQDDFSYWNSTKSVSGSKLVVGVPFYGYGWGTMATANNDEIPYCTIVTNNTGAENNDQVGSGSNVIYYNGIPTIKQKTTYAMQNASGIMIWQLTEDCNDSKSLVSAIYNTIYSTAAVEQSQSVMQDKFVLYPNPFENNTILQCKGIDNSRIIEVINTQGVLRERFQTDRSSDQIILGTSLEPGIYFVKIQEGNSITNLKLIKK